MAVQFGPEGEEPGDDGRGVGAAQSEVGDDGADAIGDAEAGFVVGVEGEEDCVCGEEGDALGQAGAEEGWLEGFGVGEVVVEESGAGLVEVLVGV